MVAGCPLSWNQVELTVQGGGSPLGLGTEVSGAVGC